MNVYNIHNAGASLVGAHAARSRSASDQRNAWVERARVYYSAAVIYLPKREFILHKPS